MAYALKFNKDVTALIYSFRDFMLEDVIKVGGTPSAIAMKAFTINNPGSGYIDIERGPHYQRYIDKYKCWVETYRAIPFPWGRDPELRELCWAPNRTVLVMSGLRRVGLTEKNTCSIG